MKWFSVKSIKPQKRGIIKICCNTSSLLLFHHRANILYNTLKNEEFEKLKNGRDWGDIRPGDSVEVEKLPYMTALTPDIIKGVVIGIRNKFSDTGFTIINVRLMEDLTLKLVT